MPVAEERVVTGTASAVAPEPAPRTSRFGWLALLPMGLFALTVDAVLRGDLPIVRSLRWVPSLGIDFAIRLDGLALQFILLITGIGGPVLVYAAGYMAGDPRRARLFAMLMVFMVAMLGCVSADDFVMMFVFWELTSITSFLLVGFKHEYEATRRSAQQALMVTAGGGLVLLVGVLLFGQIAGTYSLHELLQTAPAWRDHPLVPIALGCTLIGAFTKSAQFPFHFWLPNAMAAPTPVSAYLHSATMVKLGIYLLARLHPALGDMWIWQVVLISVGGFTSAWAMVRTLREKDLKRILAWSTVSSLGTLVMLIGLPGEGAAIAVAAFLLAHALYKAPLFFVAGNVDHATGTRDIDRLGALAPKIPFTAAAGLLAGLSMSGLPLSFGFVAKDVIKEAKVEADVTAWVAYVGVFVSAASVAVAGVAAIRVFWSRGGQTNLRQVSEVPWAMWLPPLAVAALGIVFGTFPHLVEPVITGSARSMQPVLDASGLASRPDDAAAWSALALTLGLGLGLFLFWDQLHAAQKRLSAPRFVMPEVWYNYALGAIPRVAGAVTRRVQHGSLPGYALTVLAFMLASLSLAAWHAGHARWPALDLPSLGVGGACLALVLASVAVCVVRDSFVLLLVSGLVGLASALLFLFLGAPDVALTQFAVEVAFVVVIAAVLLRVRRLDLMPPGPQRVWPRAAVALGAGVLVAGLLLAATAGPLDPALPAFFAERSVSDAHGRNVVNVILVDFRAVDTLGEISVVAVSFLAAMPLFALLRPRKGAHR